MFKFFRKRQQPAPSPAMKKMADDINKACLPLAAAIAVRANAFAPPAPTKRKTMWPFNIPKKRREEQAREDEYHRQRAERIALAAKDDATRHEAQQRRWMDQRNANGGE